MNTTTSNKGAHRNGTRLVKAEYHDIAVTFTEDAWFNATEVADRFGKRPIDWIRLDETQAYLKALSEALGISEPKSLIRAKRNSGTWLHPKLAVRFAQWLDIRFAVWCDMQIDMLLKGTHSGACPGYVIDHIQPLKRGGVDAPSNMQWQTKEEAKEKDRWE